MMKKWLMALIAVTGLALMAADELPPYAQVTVGEIKIEVAKRVFWNMNGIWYKGRPVCRRNAGFYGAVIGYQGLGWVGTGHMENKIGETELKVEFFLDGKPWQPVSAPVACNTFEMRKSSLLHQIRVDYTLKLEKGRIYEDARLTVEKEAKFGVLYLFMHPWEPVFTEYRMVKRGGEEDKGVFSAENKGKMIEVPAPAWGSYYAPQEKIGFVSVVRDTSAAPIKNDSWLMWNRGNDRKLYYVAARTSTVQAGQQFSYKMVTAFFTGENAPDALAQELTTL